MDNVSFALEEEIAQELKAKCDEKGKERNPSISAKLLHKLGIVYKERSPDLICLIKSAALFNAAIARKPENISEIQQDLQWLCGHVLHVAKAKQKDVDLVKQAKVIKQAFEKMRRKVNDSLQKIKQISDEAEGDELLQLEREKYVQMCHMQNGITSDYKLVMSSLSEYCIGVMGDPPCKFAHVGMGSMARSEITPYSDYENIIILEEGCQNNDHIYHQEILPFFRSYAVIFQIVLINLQETILPSVSIASLNDTTTKGGNWFFDAFTTRGVSFDGMMPHACKSPLGRQQPTQSKPWKTELIKPVSKMLKYLETDENLKNGYHLADILTKTCFVYGEKSIYDQFHEGMINKLNSSDENTLQEQIRSQVKEDIDNFSAKSSLSTSQCTASFNFKRIVYRSSTLFISALGRLHNIVANSCFEILEFLEEKGVLRRYSKEKLLFCVAVACEIRLIFYMKSQGQNDWIGNISKGRNKTNSLISIVGKGSCISYFQIVYSLQCEICRMLNIKRTHLYSDLRFMNIAIYEFLDLKDEAEQLLIDCSNKLSMDSQFRDIDSCLSGLKSSTNRINNTTGDKTKASTSKTSKPDGHHFYQICNSLYQVEKYHEAVEFGKKYLSYAITEQDESENLDRKGRTLYCVGCSLSEMGQFQKAVAYLEKCLKVQRTLSTDEDSDENLARTSRILGCCFMHTGFHEEAIRNLQKSLAIFETISPKKQSDRNVAIAHNNIGACLSYAGRYDEAMVSLEKSLEIYQRRSLEDENNPLEWSRSIFERSFLLEENDKHVATVFMEIARCLIGLGRYKDAIIYLNKTLKIYEIITSDEDTDNHISYTLNFIGLCLYHTERYNESLIFYAKSYKIYQRASADEDTDRSVARTLESIGSCLTNIQKYEKAIIAFQKSLKIYKRISSDEATDGDVSRTVGHIENCLKQTIQCAPPFSKTILGRALAT